MRRIIAMLLAIVMLLGNVPFQAFATEEVLQEVISCGTEGCTFEAGHEGECSNFVAPTEPAVEPAADAAVYVTVSVQGGLGMACEEVIVSDINADGRLSVDEALYAAHVAYGKGYGSQEGAVTQLWGVETTNVSFFVNHAPISTDVSAETIGYGDYLVASVDQNTDYDKYSRFQTLETHVNAGEAFTLTLTDDAGNALAGMEIGLWNGSGSTTMTGLTTDVNGSVIMTLDQEGLYCVTAKGTAVETAIDVNTMEAASFEAPIVAPVCVVVVTGTAAQAPAVWSVSEESDLGSVQVIVENTTYPVADGAPWDGVLVDVQVPLTKNMTMMSAILTALDNAGHTWNYNSGDWETTYISSIEKDGTDGLGEFTGGAMAGWMGTLNDWLVNMGFVDWKVSDGTLASGDVIRLMYSMDMGADLGGGWGTSTGCLSSFAVSAGTLSPAFEKDTLDYTLTIDSSVTSVDITAAAESKEDRIVITAGGSTYRRGTGIPVADGTVINVACGEGKYTITVSAQQEKVEPINAVVAFAAQAKGEYLAPPQLAMTVSSDTAENFGYNDQTDMATQVSTIDVLVAAHVVKYGAAFTEATAKTYLQADGNFITTMFGADNSGNVCMLVNGLQPGPSDYKYGVEQAVVTDGDLVEFFVYQNAAFTDKYVWLELPDGTKVDGQSVYGGKTATVVVMGRSPFSYGYEGDTGDTVISGADIYLVDIATGTLVPLGVSSGADGTVSITVPEAYVGKTVYLAAKGTEMAMTLAKVTVEQAPVSTACNLSSLEVAVGGSTIETATAQPLSPDFTGTTTEYSTSILDYESDKNNRFVWLKVSAPEGTTVTAKCGSSNTATLVSGEWAVLQVQGGYFWAPTYSGPLTPGAYNEVIITVSKEGESDKVYTVTIPMQPDVSNRSLAWKTDLTDAIYFTKDTETASLSVEAQYKNRPLENEDTITYQWYSSTSGSTEGGTAIEGATDASYAPNVTALGTSYYYVVASCKDLESITSNVIAVTVTDEAMPTSVTIVCDYPYTIPNTWEKALGGVSYVAAAGDTLQLKAVDENGKETPVVWLNTSINGGTLDKATGIYTVKNTAYSYVQVASLYDANIKSEEKVIEVKNYAISEYNKTPSVTLAADGQSFPKITAQGGLDSYTIWQYTLSAQNIAEQITELDKKPARLEFTAMRPGTIEVSFDLDLDGDGKADGNGQTDSAKLSINGIAVEDADGKLTKTYLEISAAAPSPTMQLKALSSTENAAFTWSSADETVATVDENGLVTAKGVGSVIISANDGTYTGGIKVVVTSGDTPYFEQIDFATTNAWGTGLSSNTWKSANFKPLTLEYTGLSLTKAAASTLTLNASTLYNTEKYTAIASYTDENGQAQQVAINSGAVTELKNIPFETSTLTITLTDKADETKKTVYTFTVTRPRDTVKTIANGGIVFVPDGREIWKNTYNGKTEGIMYVASEDGNFAQYQGVMANRLYYRTYAMDALAAFSLTLKGTSAYSHVRFSVDDGTTWSYLGQSGSGLSTGKIIIPQPTDTEHSVVKVMLQLLDDQTYAANIAAGKDGFGDSTPNTYTVWVEQIPHLSVECDILTAVTDTGDWYPAFDKDRTGYRIVGAPGTDTALLTFTVSDNAKVSVGGEELTANDKSEYTLALTSASQSVIVASSDGTTEKTYSFGYSPRLSNAVPDKVTDYLLINGQYINGNGGGYGVNPQQTLTGGLLSLGNFGGYVTFYYEEGLTDNPNNPYGVDFYVNGNAFKDTSTGSGLGSMEPGQVWISENGTDWYALAGSEHYEENTLWDYAVTYSKTETGGTAWTDNQGNTHTSTHGRSFAWPNADVYNMNDLPTRDSFTLSGILIPCVDGTITGSDAFNSYSSGARFGYVDTFVNGTANPYLDNSEYTNDSTGFDLAWAVDAAGNPVDVSGKSFHYVKVVTASNILAGTANEKSTEVGDVVRAAASDAAVGVTSAPSGVTFASGESTYTVDFADAAQVYEITIPGSLAESSILVNGTSEDDNIYINNQRVASGTASSQFSFQKDSQKLVRIIVQNGEKEPVIYLLKVLYQDTVAVESITLDKTEVTAEVGETVTLTATVTPDNATDKTVTWSSSDVSVAMAADGVVTALKAGTATITVKAGGKEAACVVTVNEKIATPFSQSVSVPTNGNQSWGHVSGLTLSGDDGSIYETYWSSATEPYVLDVILGQGTPLDAAITATFTVGGMRAPSVSGEPTVKLENGEGAIQITIVSSVPSFYSDSHWTINLKVDDGSAANRPTHTVTLPSDTEGYTVAAYNSESPVIEGREFSFTVTIDDDHKAGDSFAVKVNGEVVEASNGIYTIENITEAKTVTVEGVEEKTLADKNVVIVVPAGSTVSSGRFYSYFKYDFNEPLETTTLEDGRLQFVFPVPGNQGFLRVQHPQGVTYWDFDNLNAGILFEITEEMLFIGSSEFTKETVYANFEKNAKDKADLYLTANEKGWLDLNTGDTWNLNVFRNFLSLGNSISNTHVALPDVEYKVISVDGTLSDVISVTPNEHNSSYAEIKAEKPGTAIILVSYDAVYNNDGEGGKQWSAIWPENTGVIVVTVDAEDASIATNMTVNEEANSTGKQVIDAEHDILFYVGDSGASYSFQPEGGCTVTVNRSTVGSTMTFGGFTSAGVETAEDGTVTVTGLTTGTHIIKVEKDGKAVYQVVRARQVSYELLHSDGTLVSAENPAQPGESITVQFYELISPMEKLSGVYNTNFGFYYTDPFDTTITTSGGTYGVYTFSGSKSLQKFSVTIPTYWNESTYTLTNGAIKIGGFGSNAGSHRTTTYIAGKEVNTNASGVSGVLSVLPDVHITTNPCGYNSYNVTLPTGDGYTVTGGNVPVPAGETYTFTVAVKGGYDSENMVVKVNGNAVTGENGTYEVKNVTEDLTITVEGVEKITVDMSNAVAVYTNGVDGTGWGRGEYAYVDVISIGGAAVESYSWDGDTCNVTLAANTAKNASVGFVITFAGNPASWVAKMGATLNGTAMTAGDPMVIKLVDGEATVELFAAYNNSSRYGGTKTFRITRAASATEDDAEKVKAVINLIEAIGTVTKDSKAEIEAARAAYDALTEEQKAQVTNYEDLTEAEETLKLLDRVDVDIVAIYNATGDDLAAKNLSMGTIHGEWAVLGLVRSGRTVAESYYESVAAAVKSDRLHAVKSTENSRVILALTAIGKDVTNVNGYNLLSGLNEMSYITKQGINGAFFALIALDSHDYEPTGDVTREKLVQTILEAQLSDGGWSLSSSSDVDMTAMAIQSLAPYYDTNAEVKSAVDKALTWLSGVQHKDGSFGSTDGACAESIAQVIVALTALGIDPDKDDRFIKTGISPVQALAQFYVEGGGFAHIPGTGRNDMATEQSYYALAAYMRFRNGQSALYDMSDVTLETDAQNQAAAAAVEALIDAIGTVDLTKEDQIEAAREAYDALTDAQKELVSNYQTLTDAETELAQLKQTAADAAAADAVKDLIQAIGTVDSTAKAAQITAARDAYNALTDLQKDLVGAENLKLLTDAEAALAALQKAEADAAAADRVETLISAIGSSITLGSETKITTARNAYNALTADQKALVSNYQTLLNAEAALNALKSTVSVTFSLLGCYEHGTNETSVHTLAGGNLQTWIAAKTYKIQPGDTVQDLLEKALTAAGMTWSNPTGNYVESINGIGEFTNGSKSGWMYTLNGKHPSLGVAQQTLVNGDVVVFHYTDDYTKEESSTSGSGSTGGNNNYVTSTTTATNTAAAEAVERLITDIGDEITLDSEAKIKAARAAYDKLTETQKKLVENYEKLVEAETSLANLKSGTGEDVYQETGDYIQGLGTPGVGTIGGEWMVIGLARSDRDVPAGYYDHVVDYVRENINDKEQLHSAKSTDNSRLILALTAIGEDVTDVDGHDLLKGLSDMDYLQKQGINGPIWALLAFDSGNYPVPEGNVSREALVNVILEAQLADGGWALSGENSDPDLTAMAIQALAPYVDSQVEVENAVEDAFMALSEMQNDNGSFSSIDGANSESIAQVIVALSALGVDADQDARFIKNGISALDALVSYYVPGGGFRHVLDGNLDGMATEQAYYALVAYNRMQQGKNFLYDMTDVIDMGGDPVVEETTEPTQIPTEPAEEETEDENPAVIWITVMAICAGVIVLVLLNRKKLFGNRM